MFNDKYGLTEAVLAGSKTMTRRIVPDGTPLGNWEETEKMSRFKIGEVVAVAQSYKDTGNYPESYIIDEFHPNIEFEAGWNNKMFVSADLMPHQIRITNVRVERLQDISDEDCFKEGIYLDETAPSCYQPFYTFKESQEHGTPVGYQTAREAFAALIYKVSGKGTWQSNPLVFVYEFELIK